MQNITPKRQRQRAHRLCQEGLVHRLGQRLLLEEQQILDTYKVRRETLHTLVEAGLLHREPRLDGVFYELGDSKLAQLLASTQRSHRRRVRYGGLLGLGLLGLSGVLLVLQQRDAAELARLRAQQETVQQQHAAELAEVRAQQEAVQQQHAAELAEARAQQAKDGDTVVQTALLKARRARAEAEKLLSFLLFDLRDQLQLIGRADAMDDIQKRVNAYYEHMPVDDDNAQILRQRGVAYNNQGNTLLAQGNLLGALQAYESFLTIAKKLAAQDPNEPELQRDLSVGYEKVGDALMAQNQYPDALQAYRNSLALTSKLAAQDSANVEWQRDLSVSYNKLGDVLVADGQRTEALQAYRESLAIRAKLVTQDTRNARWQMDLVVSFWKIAAILDRASPDEKQEAREKLTQALRILRTLQAQGRLAPRDQTWVETIQKQLATL